MEQWEELGGRDDGFGVLSDGTRKELYSYAKECFCCVHSAFVLLGERSY